MRTGGENAILLHLYLGIARKVTCLTALFISGGH